MCRIARVMVTLVLVAPFAACGTRTEPAKGSAEGSATASPPPATCPPGSVIKDGACTAVVTAEKIAAVGQQQSRLDELARLLDQVEMVGAPIELFDGIRQLEQWQSLKAKSAKIAALDAIGGTLNNAVKTLRAFKGSLGEASARLGNLKAELDKVMAGTGGARQIEEVRAAVSSQLRTALEPLGAQVQDTIQNALVPLTTQLSELSDVVITGCTMAKVSGGGDKMKELCAQAKDVFAKAIAYVGDLKTRPAQLFTDVTAQLETQLDQLVDTQTKQLVDAAQRKVNEALNLPSAGSTAGSTAGTGATGSAAGTGATGSAAGSGATGW